MRSGDAIILIDSTSTAGMTTDQAVGLIRGPAGTVVNLDVIRPESRTPSDSPSSGPPLTFPSLTTRFMLEPGVGYIRLSRFSEESADEVAGAIRDLVDQGADALVFDIRANSGGLLEPAVSIADLFLPHGSPVVTTRARPLGSTSTER
jgi:carboxyl-terminal processing protease